MTKLTPAQRRDLARLEQLADRAKKAESAGFALSHPGSPALAASSINRSTSSRSPRAPVSARLPPTSASRRSSPLPPASVNAEYLDDNGDRVRVYGPSGTINLDPKHPDNGGDPFSDRQSVSTLATSTHSTNIIPIQYIPSSRSEDAMSTAQAAKRLDEARQNLFRPGVPARPARSGDSTYRDPRSPSGHSGPPRIRDSYVSDNSAAPSFWSGGSYDVHNDAPKIVTSRQVHVGKLQHAEVVHMGKNRGASPIQAPDQYDSQWDKTPTPATFGGRVRPPSPGYATEEGLRGDGESSREPQSAGPNDLRFSMDSLAYRDSMSSMGTFRYLAQADPSALSGATPRPLGPSSIRSPSKPPVYLPGGTGPGRDSTFSNKSYADSVLSGFPMIPPSQSGNVPPLPTGVPQSSSSNTLDGQAQVPRPPGSFRPPPTHSQMEGAGRPLTTASVADSLLGSFPFVPPNMDDLAELPSAALPTGVAPDTAKRQ